MKVLFSFDTEDYVDPASNDALLELAKAHSKHGVPATFGVVGEKARFLRDHLRWDAIEAVKQHEVAYHSAHHYMLPDRSYDVAFTPEHMELSCWDEALRRLIEEESRGLHDVSEIFGVRPVTWLRTYGDWAPQYLAAFERLGLGVYGYGPPSHLVDPTPIWYCNQLVVANPRMSYESTLHDQGMSAQEKLEGHKRTFLNHLEQGCERLGVVTHPTRFISDIWWEEPNWWTGVLNAPPRCRWQAPPRFSSEKTTELLWIVDRFLEYVAGLADVDCVQFADFWAARRARPPWLAAGDVQALARSVSSGKRPQWQRLHSGETFSPAEVFAVFVFALSHADAEMAPVRTMFGPVEEPHEGIADRHLPREDLRRTCVELEYGLRDRPRVPAVVRTSVGAVGPGEFLMVMAQALATPGAPDAPRLTGVSNLPEPMHADDYERLGLRAPACYIQKRNAFPMPRTTRLSQLQYWTVRPD